MDLFPFIGPEHPFYTHIERIRAEVSRNLLGGETLRPDSTTQILTLMRGRRLPGGGWGLRRVYVSLQSRNESSPLRFDARTLFYSEKRQHVELYEFPRDPYLTTAASFFAGATGRWRPRDSNLEVDILKYVPRRRLTLLVRRPLEGDAPVVGKFVRRAQLEATYETLGKVYRTVARAPSIFSVAAPKGIDRDSSVFFQEARSGRPLTAVLDTDRSSEVFRSVGAIHRDVHTLDVPHVPTWDVRAFLDDLTMRVQWIAFFCPEQASFLEDAQKLLFTHVPGVDPAAYTFCHGDFRCSHVLQNDGGWSVVDFDGAMRADPYLEVAELMAFLKYEVPFFRQRFVDPRPGATEVLDAACHAYVEGYQERAQQALDPRRLLWYRIGCEIHYLARVLARDVYNPIAFHRTLRLLHDLTERFRAEAVSLC